MKDFCHQQYETDICVELERSSTCSWLFSPQAESNQNLNHRP